MLQQSCLYARGITPAFTGNPGDGSQGYIDAMGVDSSAFTSLVIEGHSQAYICGYASVYMNGRFVRPNSPLVDGSYGWLGDYRNKSINNMGALRQLMSERGYNSNIAVGQTMLVMSDYASVTDENVMESWGQLVGHMRRAPLDMVAHPWYDINNGAYGYDGTPAFFKQWSSVMLLLSAQVQTLPAAMCNALREAHRNGVNLIILQKGPYEGNANFNAIFAGLGLVSNGAAYVGATAYSKARSVALYGDHVGWSYVNQLHNQQNFRLSAVYRFTVPTQPGPGWIGGQPGAWFQFYCGQVDITDDISIDPLVEFRDNCCVDIGSAYGVNFDVSVNPVTPADWRERTAAGDISISWSSDNAVGIRWRSSIYCNVVGLNVNGSGINGSAQTFPGYTVVNGVYYQDFRSFTVYVISKATRTLVDRRQYDIHGSTGENSPDGVANAYAMAAYLNSLDSRYWVLVTMFDDCSVNHMAGGLPWAMYRIGASRMVYNADGIRYRSAYNCFGSPGIGEGSAINEMYWGPTDADPDSTFAVGYDFDTNGYPYITGSSRHSEAQMGINGLFDNTRSAHLAYYKVLGGIDGAKTYGTRHTVTMRDNRFKKLPMYQTKQFVVSVTNPCFIIQKVQAHDWVRRVAGAGTTRVYYPFTDLSEYLVMSTDDIGPVELCTSHIMMNWDMFTAVGNATCYNVAGPNHLMFCGSSTFDKSNPASLYFEATSTCRVWDVYERKYGLINTIPTRDSNDWQVVWRWSGPGSQGHYIPIDPGFEYICFAFDRFGDVELAERHFIVPHPENLPKWGANFYNVDFSNATLFEVDRSMLLNARCSKSKNNGWENGIMMIIRRPLFQSTGPSDRTGWQLIYNDNGPNMPQTSAIPLTMELDYQYMVLCTTAMGGFSTHHFNAWNKVLQIPYVNYAYEAESCGRCLWSLDRTTLIAQQELSTNASEFLAYVYAPVGIFQVYRRPIMCWEPNEV